MKTFVFAAAIAFLAVSVTLSIQPGTAFAQNVCDGPGPYPPECQASPPPIASSGSDGDMIASSSTSASATVELKLTIASLPMNAVGGASVELYLEDDFQVPNSIAPDTVYFTVNNRWDADAGGGGQVYTTAQVEINDGDHFGGGDDWSIRVFIPDMNDAVNSGYNGPGMGDSLSLVFTKAAGINNPSEEGTHSVGYKLLGPSDSPNQSAGIIQLGTVVTRAKISLSDDANTRGYQLTVTGSGFNNGTTAGVYVLNRAPMGETGMEKCEDIIINGANPGAVTVGSDDKAVVTFKVTVPTFRPGNQNYICMVDGEGRMSSTDIEQFHLEATIRVVPSVVSAGDTVTVFAQDYPMPGASLNGILLAGLPVMAATFNSIGNDHSGSATFEVPGGFKGTVRVEAKWGDTRARTKITIFGARLALSSSAVRPNETIFIWGSGFGDGVGCLESATIDGAPLELISSDGVLGYLGGVPCIDVEVSSAGQFVANFAVWSNSGTNPALTPGAHTIEVRDDEGFTGSATLVVKDPTVTVQPAVAGPSEYITIIGENWPVTRNDFYQEFGQEVEVVVEGQRHTVAVDDTGRFTFGHQVGSDVAMPSSNLVTVSYQGQGGIMRPTSFLVPKNKITITPRQAQPGARVTLAVSGMPSHREVSSIRIGSLDVLGRKSFTSDRNGNVTADGILVPGLPPGTYGVKLAIDDDIVFGILDILPEDTTTSSDTTVTQVSGLTAPYNLTATPSGQSGTVNLQWNPPAGAQYHFVAWIPQGIIDLNQASIMPVSAEGRATISGLTAGTAYNFTVIAGRWEWSTNFGAKWSPWTGWVTATASP